MLTKEDISIGTDNYGSYAQGDNNLVVMVGSGDPGAREVLLGSY